MANEESKARIVITYEDELTIEINDELMDDIEAIEDKPISQWFLPSNDNYAWRGLLEEIADKLWGIDASLSFEFYGSIEDKKEFFAHLNRYSKAKGVQLSEALSKDEISDNALENALQSKDRGRMDEALKYYLIAANDGESIEAKLSIAEIYLQILQDELVLSDIEKPFAYSSMLEYLRKAADQGSLDAKIKLIEFLGDEDFFPDFYICDDNFFTDKETITDFDVEDQKEKELIYWLKQAALQGHAVSQYMYGMLFLEIESKKKQGFDWILQSGKQGFVLAQYELGKYYSSQALDAEENEYEEENAAKAYSWFCEAAKQGLDEAQYLLGNCYYCGFGIEGDDTSAVEWYTKAAEQGYAKAQYKLGRCYRFGFGIEGDYESAVKWYAKAAEQGYAEAQYELGECYRLDFGDAESAVEWYIKAAEQGHSEAQYDLGKCYDDGRGVAENKQEAVVWYTKSAEQGYAPAQRKLGDCYCYGNGTIDNVELAVECITHCVCE